MKTKFINQMIILIVHPRSALLLLHLLLIAQIHFGQQQQQQQFSRPKGSRHPRYCTRHSDCVGQEICSDRACVDAKPTSKRCANDQACPNGQGCIMERCWEEDKTSYTCKTTTNCPPQTICRNNLCVHAQPTFSLCKADSMCKANQACRNGLCWQAATTTSDEFVCKTYNDCPKKWICLLGVCKEGEPTNKRCVSTETCKEMHECVDGLCWKQLRSSRCKQHSDCQTSMVCHKDVCHDAVRTFSCNAHSDCGQNNLCISRACVEAEMTGKECIGDEECGVKQACKDGQCWKIVNDPNSKFCNNHDECDQFEICMKNQCAEGEVTNKACVSKAECNNDEICKQGICVKPRGSSSTNLCKVHDDCDDSMLCKNNECLDAIITERDCSQDSECPDGGCRDTICWKLTDFNAGKPHSSCRKHNDCSGQLICHKGTCQSGKPSDDECNSDLDCPRTRRCKLGLCWEVPDSNCELHSHCDHYSICKNSKCRLAQPYEKKCHSDDHCELGDYCKFDICWNVISECRVHEECDEQYLCHNGACRQAEPNGEECFNENDCKTNEMCYGELCWQVAMMPTATHTVFAKETPAYCTSLLATLAHPTYSVPTVIAANTAYVGPMRATPNFAAPHPWKCKKEKQKSNSRRKHKPWDLDCTALCTDVTGTVHTVDCKETFGNKSIVVHLRKTCPTIMMASLFQVVLLLFWLYKAQLINCDHQAKSPNIGLACQLSSECGGQALCANKHCMPAAPTNRQCDTVKECRTNENCRYGICWKVFYASCRRNSDCIKPLTCQYGFCDITKWPTTCKKHHDCPGQLICINEKCIVAQPTETECDTDLQCLRNEACKQGICWKAHKEIKKCTKHTECKNQSLCVYGKCKQAYPTDRRCQNDRGCLRSEGCLHGICWRVDNSQRAERTKLALISISVMTVFVASEVQPIEYAPVIKTANTMKDASMAFVGIFQIVLSVHMLLARAISGERCYTDAECGKLELCVSDHCRMAIPTHRDCESSNQCRREEKCRFDMCWKLYMKEEDILGKYCKRHADCKDQFMCYRGKCQIAAPTNQNCENDNNCPPKQVCKHGICWTLAHACDALNSNINAKSSPQTYCISHDSCSNFTICYRKQCVPAIPTKSRCKHVKNCEAEQRCLFGRCWKQHLHNQPTPSPRKFNIALQKIKSEKKLSKYNDKSAPNLKSENEKNANITKIPTAKIGNKSAELKKALLNKLPDDKSKEIVERQKDENRSLTTANRSKIRQNNVENKNIKKIKKHLVAWKNSTNTKRPPSLMNKATTKSVAEAKNEVYDKTPQLTSRSISVSVKKKSEPIKARKRNKMPPVLSNKKSDTNTRVAKKIITNSSAAASNNQKAGENDRTSRISRSVKAKQIAESKTVLKCEQCKKPTAAKHQAGKMKITTRSSKAKNVIEEIAEPILDLFDDDNEVEDKKTTENSTKLKPAKRCSNHTQCGVVEMCVNKKCHSATPTKQRCQSAQQCPSRLCRYGRCWQPDSPNVQVVDVKKRKTSFCTVSKQCTSQQICLNGICTVAYPGTQRCTSSQQCKKNQICRYGRCWTANMQEALQEHNKKPVEQKPETPSAPEDTNPEEGNKEEGNQPEEGNEEEENQPEEGNEEEALPEEDNAEEPAEEEQPEEDAEEDTEAEPQAAEEKRLEEPEPAAEPEQVQEQEPEEVPELVEELEPVEEPEPVADPEPVEEAEPEEEPEPVEEPEPEKEPKPVEEPEPVAEPEVAKETEPAEEPADADEPEPEKEPKPVEEPEPVAEPEVAKETEPAEEPADADEPEPEDEPGLLENAKSRQDGGVVEEINPEMQVKDVLLQPPVMPNLEEDQHNNAKPEESQNEEYVEIEDGEKDESKISVNKKEKSESIEKIDDEANEHMSSENDTDLKSSEEEISKEDKEEVEEDGDDDEDEDDDDKESVNENDNTDDEEVSNDESDKNSKNKKKVKKDCKEKMSNQLKKFWKSGQKLKDKISKNNKQ
ncbi:Cell surface glycoprotein 1 [Trichinella pseudospiralis]|uniref:Cell surface glycoprotein 1 n=1 Tax=Trichinella pseudospiralis TaxID=6337 RepID=A0A0V1K0Z2_TRIPS|nr:Cell surface glycoprotein 1 [Trichinella pseudospiralis]